MALRFPDAPDAAGFWRNILEGRSSVKRALLNGESRVGAGAALEGIEHFDASFFGISKGEAEVMDPQHRVFLECCSEALEDAGYTPESGARAGVYAGCSMSTYLLMNVLPARGFSGRPDELAALICNDKDYLATRVSYLLNLTGPSVGIQTACSSSLVAVHMASQGVLNGECDLAIAGGVTIRTPQIPGYLIREGGYLSARGECRPFDADADGAVFGNGAGCVVLKRLEDALAAGDRIHAVLRGSAINNDGARKPSFTAPSVDGQQEAIVEALAVAGVDASTIGLIDAHGTGTPLGDPIEIAALSRAFRQFSKRERFCAVQSIKANLGHLECAAGIASLIKAVLSLKHGTIPPACNFRSINPQIETAGPFYVNLQATAWPGEGPRRAGVSSFGIGGTNAHVIVEEAPEQKTLPPPPSPPALLLPLSARSRASLDRLLDAYIQLLEDPATDAAAVCHSAALRRSHHPLRAAACGSDASHLRAALLACRLRPSQAGTGVVFVYPGQGGQWTGMGSQLRHHFPVFARVFERCREALLVAGGWDVEPAEPTCEQEIGRVQAANWAIECALTELWRSWGIEAQAVVGHSMGESAAAWAAGVLSLEEAARVMVERGRLLESQVGQGAMLAVERGPSELGTWLAGSEVEIAAENSPRWSVVTGRAQAVAELEQRLASQEISWRRLRTSGVAGHSREMESLQARLQEALQGLQPGRARLRMISTVSGERVQGRELGAEYWARHLRAPVRFGQAVRELAREGYQIFVEVGPHPVLSAAVAECVEAEGREALVLGSLRREAPEMAEMLASLGQLYCAGQRVRWQEVYPDSRPMAPLPLYPWNRQRCWIDPPTPTPPTEAQLVEETEIPAGSELHRAYDALVRRWPVEGAAAINRKQLAPYVFLTQSRDSLFYCFRTSQSVTALLYAGAEEAHPGAVADLIRYAERNGLQAQFMVEEHRLARLENVSATPAGILQFLPDLRTFTLNGTGMRRLRHPVQKYGESGHCNTADYRPGTDAATDARLVSLAQEWGARKGRTPSFIDEFTRLVTSQGSIAPLRLFITERNHVLEGAVLLSPAGRGGYLMDVELYGASTGYGCLEFSIVRIIEQLRAEGISYFSLGGTYGTRLADHPNSDPHAQMLLSTLHRQNVLNGDSNAQFKSKFRPECERLFLCRPKGAGADGLEDMLLMLVGCNAQAHALNATRLPLPIPDHVFETRLRAEQLAYLRHHQVDGRAVLPGAAYLELLLAVMGQKTSSSHRAIENLTLSEPLFLAQDSETIMHLVVKNGVGDRAGFEIFSRHSPAEDPGAWTSHASGILTQSRALEPHDRLPIEELKRRLPAISIQQFYRDTAASGTLYDGPFHRVKQLNAARGEGVGLVSSGAPGAHAAALDGALQVLLAAAQTAGASAACWMQGIERVVFHRPLGEKSWSHAQVLGVDSGRIHGDVHIYDSDLRLAIEIEGVIAIPRRSQPAAAGNSDLYTLRWRPAPGSLTAGASLAPRGAWMVMSDRGDAVERMAEALERRGVAVKRHPAESQTEYRTMLQAVGDTVDSLEGIVHCWGAHSGTAPSPLAELACRRALLFSQAVTEQPWKTRPKVWFVTHLANSIHGERQELHLGPMWGFARVFSVEHPEHYGGLADIDDDPRSVDRFAAVALSRTAEKELAIRDGRVFLPRLERLDAGMETPAAIRPEGTYLVTGGLGGLGLATAQWLVDRGARHLCLVTREPAAHTRELTVVEELRTRGADVLTECADVADANALKRAIHRMRRTMPPCRGVVHAAGIIVDAAISRASWDSFASVLRPKIQGAWNLHELTVKMPLDFFVLYSSAAGLLGPMGQANHAAASAFLDGFAHWRRQQGLPALSIDWGPWSTTGAAADKGIAARLSFRGIQGCTSAEGMRLLESALACSSAQVAALKINWLRWAASVPYRHGGTLWSELSALPSPVKEPSSRAFSPSDSQQDVAAYLRKRVCSLLGMPVTGLDAHRPLAEYGFDSLMSISLRRSVESDLGIRIPIVHFFQSANLLEMTDMVKGRLSPAPAAAHKPALLFP
jgi:acyl transferase domain-containing protein